MALKKTVTAGFIAGAVSIAIAGATAAQAEEKAPNEKCYGIAKAGQNDCADAAKAHSCMGHATADSSADEWIAVPAGLCERLVGGSLTPGNKDEKASCDAKSTCQGKDSEDHHG